ncbi:unnamed protein product, partial [Brassica rapa subsp. trilocularis]
VVLVCRRGLWNPRVSVAPIYGVTRWWILKLCGIIGWPIMFPLLEARSWQEAKSNLVTAALGKEDRIAWCWTLGPPV